MLGHGELLVIVLVILVLFGGAAIPKFARSLGQAKKEFAKGMKEAEMELSEDEKKAEEKSIEGKSIEGKNLSLMEEKDGEKPKQG